LVKNHLNNKNTAKTPIITNRIKLRENITIKSLVLNAQINIMTKQLQGFEMPSYTQLECGPMSNAMATLPNIGGTLCSTPQSLADVHY